MYGSGILPAGHSCPYAKECLIKVEPIKGKFDVQSKSFRCYAASAERFPGVRRRRWLNFRYVLLKGKPVIPKECKAIRIHASGDFFSQEYFDMWLGLAERNPNIEMWAFTKSIRYWLARLDKIPKNLILTASYGGKDDVLIEKHNLKYAVVIDPTAAITTNLSIDTNDDCARVPDMNFCLLDNNKKVKE